MAPTKQPTTEDRSEAIRIALAGLASREAPEELLAKLEALHIPRHTFPAEELLELASDAIDVSGATPADPVDLERIRERFLSDFPFSGKTQHYKSKYAISAAAMIHGDVYPDLLDDAAWWEADDLWRYSLFCSSALRQGCRRAHRALCRRRRPFGRRSPWPVPGPACELI